MSDNERILEYMREHGSITSADAWREFGCVNARARISDLRGKGYAIGMVREECVDRFGDKTYYGRWYLKEEKNAVVRD